MAYIGTDINYGNIAKQTGTGDGSDTTPIAALTYTVPSNESILVFLDGVAQVPGTDFTAASTTLTFTTAPANGVAILVMFLGRSLDIGTPGDSTVTLAKMAANSIDSDQYVDGSIDAVHLSANSVDSDSYVDGSIDAVHLSANSVDSDAYVDGSIDLAHMSSQSVDEDNLHISNSGSNGNFLSKQSGDSGGLTWAAVAGGQRVLIESHSFSSEASHTFTGLNFSTYDMYECMISGLHPSGAATIFARVGDSGGIDSGGSDYQYHSAQAHDGSTGYGSTVVSGGTTQIQLTSSLNTTAGMGGNCTLYIVAGVTLPSLWGVAGNANAGSDAQGGHYMGVRNVVLTMTQLQILTDSGTIVTGRATLFGIKHT